MWSGEHTMTVAAKPNGIWERWTRFELWGKDDPDTAWARLEQPLAVGAIGKVKPRRGPASSVQVTAIEEPTRFDCESRLPGAVMRFEHELRSTSEGTEFTHRLVLTGPASRLFAQLIGRRIVAGFPDVMSRLAQAADPDARSACGDLLGCEGDL